ncbi:MAG TPA: class I SAM-dependent methyltransferase [Blastocatellia bacterium]|nr:class I SAM-dependent methyltransferase [Blastocatellia bacterium]HMV83124.1 class I SAM-dependent methyltransferase [Blastocatellia bacterium]HMX26495.1 class I SAM-dependent methyltransferase [Blastocatellia bacterium]HMY71152.1 class I SAM-dependent methyltransferase [Blastocatellia bacterium]HMZ20414.1 class I SAM-dependent methyltransferase [Blastocatellia bacterium]
MRKLLPIIILFVACSTAQPNVEQAAPQSQSKPVYETRAQHDPDGIGKFYLGREIAHVMGHQGAEWLERPDRVETELPDEVVKQMNLKPTDVVADIGAGTGYFTFRLAPVVKQGKVLAVDIQPEMLSIIEGRKKRFKADNVEMILSTETDTKLPAASVDVVLFVDAYHEFSFPREMMESIVRGLKPGGRVVQIEYRGEDPDVPIKRLHKMTVAQAKKEMAAVGLVWKETKSFLPQQHFLVFEKPSVQYRER